MKIKEGMDTDEEKLGLEKQLFQAQKMEALGTLSAGVAHEINTPIQFIGDNSRFLQDAFVDIEKVFKKLCELRSAIVNGGDIDKLALESRTVDDEADMEYIMEEAPKAIEQILEGVDRVSTIVKAMKAFSHHDHDEMENADLNKALNDTLIISRNEYKYVADTETELDPDLPTVPCYLNELNQVFLNIIVNASHAIASANSSTPEKRGRIAVKTSVENDEVVIRISDTGTGIPEDVRHRIFEPFFTTKEVGKGTGQGLSISHSVVTQKHKGTLDFESEHGRGTTFIIGLPLRQESENSA